MNVSGKKFKRINLMSYVNFLLLFIGGVLLTACDTPLVRQYEGPVKNKSDIAILYHKQNMGWMISETDGKAIANGLTTWSGSAGVDEIHLLPGEHEITGSLRVEDKSAYFRIKYAFEAGKEYQLSYKLLDEVVGNRVIIYIKKADNVDKDDKKNSNINVDNDTSYY